MDSEMMKKLSEILNNPEALEFVRKITSPSQLPPPNKNPSESPFKLLSPRSSVTLPSSSFSPMEISSEVGEKSPSSIPPLPTPKSSPSFELPKEAGPLDIQPLDTVLITDLRHPDYKCNISEKDYVEFTEGAVEAPLKAGEVHPSWNPDARDLNEDVIADDDVSKASPTSTYPKVMKKAYCNFKKGEVKGRAPAKPSSTTKVVKSTLSSSNPQMRSKRLHKDSGSRSSNCQQPILVDEFEESDPNFEEKEEKSIDVSMELDEEAEEEAEGTMGAKSGERSSTKKGKAKVVERQSDDEEDESDVEVSKVVSYSFYIENAKKSFVRLFKHRCILEDRSIDEINFMKYNIWEFLRDRWMIECVTYAQSYLPDVIRLGPDFCKKASKKYRKVFVRGRIYSVTPEEIKEELGITVPDEMEDTVVTASDEEMAKRVTGKMYKKWDNSGRVSRHDSNLM